MHQQGSQQSINLTVRMFKIKHTNVIYRLHGVIHQFINQLLHEKNIQVKNNLEKYTHVTSSIIAEAHVSK